MTNDELDTLLFCSFRYALGRKTYIVDDIAGLLIANRDILRPQTIEKIKQEIKEAINNKRAGMICDVDSWLRVWRSL